MKRLILTAMGLLFAATPAHLRAQARFDYKIVPNDVIIIDVFGEKDFSREFRVAQTGTINYFFLKEVKVAGKTTAEVRGMLTEMLNKDYLVDPQVAVDVKEYSVREVFVNGSVNKPGSVLLTGDQDLKILEAIARAGGLTRGANSNKIKFTRPGQKERVFSLDDLKEPKNNLILQPGDFIEIPERTF